MNCNTCDSSASSPFMETKCTRTGVALTLVQCANCGLVYQDPPVDKSLGEKYLHKAYSGAEEYSHVEYFRYTEAIISRNKERYHTLHSIPLPNRTILDFGAGQGHFVKVCDDEGWLVNGVEQSPAARWNAWEQLGLNLMWNMDMVEKGSLDMITLWDVIEHLQDPKATLIALSEYLTDNGHIVIETANINSLDFYMKKKRWSFWLMDHYFYYSKQTLTDLLESIGFTIVSTPTKVTPKRRTLRMFLSPGHYMRYLKRHLLKRKYPTASNNTLITIIAKK